MTDKVLTPEEESALSIIRMEKPEFNFEFRIGKDLWSEGVIDNMEISKDFGDFVWDCLARHCTCDWGNITQEDKDTNDKSLKNGGKLCSTYTHIEFIY